MSTCMSMHTWIHQLELPQLVHTSKMQGCNAPTKRRLTGQDTGELHDALKDTVHRECPGPKAQRVSAGARTWHSNKPKMTPQLKKLQFRDSVFYSEHPGLISIDLFCNCDLSQLTHSF